MDQLDIRQHWDGSNISLHASNGDLSINSAGITMTPDSAALVDGRAYKFGVTNGRAGTYCIDSATSRIVNIRAENSTADSPYQVVELTAASLNYTAQITTVAGPSSSNIGLLADLVQIVSGVIVGSPTGGNKGAGTINVAGDLYKNGTAFSNPQWALKHHFTGAADAVGLYAAPTWYTGLQPIDAHRAFTAKHYDLPLMAQERDAGICRRGDLLLASVEEAYLYIYQLHDRIAALEATNVMK